MWKIRHKNYIEKAYSTKTFKSMHDRKKKLLVRKLRILFDIYYWNYYSISPHKLYNYTFNSNGIITQINPSHSVNKKASTNIVIEPMSNTFLYIITMRAQTNYS